MFTDARLAGAIDARGNPVTEGERKPVRARSVEADLDWLSLVFGWALIWRGPSGGYMMHENPVRGFDRPTELNPARPLATVEYFATVRTAAQSHTMQLRRGTKWQRVLSYLSVLLDIACDTGRRITAICELRLSDLRLDRSDKAPDGSIRWPGETDKEGRRWEAPITPEVRTALLRALKDRVGSGYLFPAPGNPERPINKDIAQRWLREAEVLAGIEHVERQGFHSLRRTWATDRKDQPQVDVAAAGGWKDPTTLTRIYQQADPDTMLRVVRSGSLRKASGGTT